MIFISQNENCLNKKTAIVNLSNIYSYIIHIKKEKFQPVDGTIT